MATYLGRHFSGDIFDVHFVLIRSAVNGHVLLTERYCWMSSVSSHFDMVIIVVIDRIGHVYQSHFENCFCWLGSVVSAKCLHGKHTTIYYIESLKGS